MPSEQARTTSEPCVHKRTWLIGGAWLIWIMCAFALLAAESAGSYALCLTQ